MIDEKIQLGQEQQQAIDLILQFLKSKDTCFSLVGAAGTGKSLTISRLLPQLDCNYQLCAPTHKAALVMRNYCDNDAITLHSMLSLSPKLDITKFDVLNLGFYMTKKPQRIPTKGLVICDEASMINDDLFDLIVERVKSYNSKILFVSDKAQLLPVQSTKYSKVYTHCDQTFTLTKIYRQSSENCILPILNDLRKAERYNFKTMHSPEGNLIVTHHLKEYLDNCVKDFKYCIDHRDILYVKALAYTNKAVKGYNRLIQNFIWGDHALFHKGDILTAYDSGTRGIVVDKEHKIDEYKVPFSYFNGMDYIIEEVEKGTKELPYVGIVEGFYLTLYDAYTKTYGKIFIVTSRAEINKIAPILENLRMDGVNQHRWKPYYNLAESFTSYDYLTFDNRTIMKRTFDLGYCSTIHKSQGSSYNKVYIDLTNLQICKDPLVRRQLEYVAFSRTRTDVNVFEQQR